MDKRLNKIDTKEKAYMVGYYLAKGYIGDKSVKFNSPEADVIDYISSEFNLEDIDLVTDINKHCSKKINRIPIIKKQLERYLILGIYDGIGSVNWGFRKDRLSYWHKVQFTADNIKLLEGVQNILFRQCNICSVIKPLANKHKYMLEIKNRNDVINFINYIYPDEEFIILRRKYNKANALRLELGEFGEVPRTPSEVA